MTIFKLHCSLKDRVLRNVALDACQKVPWNCKIAASWPPLEFLTFASKHVFSSVNYDDTDQLDWTTSCSLLYHPGVLTAAQQQLLKPHPERLNFWLSLVSINPHLKRDMRQIWRRSTSWLQSSKWGEASINPVHFLHVKRSAAPFLFRFSAADLSLSQLALAIILGGAGGGCDHLLSHY